MSRRPWLTALLLAAFGCEPDLTGYAAHTCALVEDGTVWCWGHNEHGALGDGTRYDRPRPAAVPGLPPARSVAAGMGFTCAATSAGEVRCWGRNDRGQLGDGSVEDRATPAPVAGLAGVVRVVAGTYAACAIGAAGEVSWWGELGDVRQVTPVPVVGLPAAAVDAFVHGGDACALLVSGDVYCWKGDGTLEGPWFPAAAIAIAPAPAEPCAVLASGAVTCVDGALPFPARALAGRWGQRCALLEDAAVWCWGEEPFGPPQRFGGDPFAPARFATDAASISVGAGYACAVQASGGVVCWGDGWSGQLGDGMQRERATPVAVVGLPGRAAAVSASPADVVWDYGCGTAATP